MQPTYLPWYGYFGLIDFVDDFVFLNDVQFEKRSWQSRNYIKTLNDKLLLSVNVKTKNKFNQLIKDVEIENYEKFKKDHLRSIELNYKKSKYFATYFDEIKIVYEKKFLKLEDLNLCLIQVICKLMKIKTNIVLSSELNLNKNKDDLYKDLYLYEICKKLSSDKYISPEGSKDYLSSSKVFKKNNIKIKYFRMNDFKYTQLHGDFISKLSVLDILFNEGELSRDIIRKNFEIYE